MASTDARPLPIKNTAYRLTFPIYKSDGTLITGASALDSEVSKDAGTFADCTNESTEIATASGVYYLDLTSTEMNADCVAIVVKTSSTGAVPPCFVLYPQESGDVKVDVQSLLGTAWLTPATAGTPDVNAKLVGGTAQTGRDIGASVLLSSGTGTGQVTLTSGRVNADMTHIATAAVSASTAQLGVNVVNFGGAAGTFASGRPEVNASHWSGTAVATPDTAGYPKVTVKSGTGTGELSLSSGAVKIQTGMKKNQALANFPFLMTDSTNHNPLPGLTVTGQRSLDGAAFASGTIANMTEVSNGIYQCDLGAGDMNGDTVCLKFTASGADDLFVTLITEP